LKLAISHRLQHIQVFRYGMKFSVRRVIRELGRISPIQAIWKMLYQKDIILAEKESFDTQIMKSAQPFPRNMQLVEDIDPEKEKKKSIISSICRAIPTDGMDKPNLAQLQWCSPNITNDAKFHVNRLMGHCECRCC
jgi:AAA15 family ATPase/GTPase